MWNPTKGGFVPTFPDNNETKFIKNEKRDELLVKLNNQTKTLNNGPTYHPSTQLAAYSSSSERENAPNVNCNIKLESRKRKLSERFENHSKIRKLQTNENTTPKDTSSPIDRNWENWDINRIKQFEDALPDELLNISQSTNKSDLHKSEIQQNNVKLRDLPVLGKLGANFQIVKIPPLPKTEVVNCQQGGSQFLTVPRQVSGVPTQIVQPITSTPHRPNLSSQVDPHHKLANKVLQQLPQLIQQRPTAIIGATDKVATRIASYSQLRPNTTQPLTALNNIAIQQGKVVRLLPQPQRSDSIGSVVRQPQTTLQQPVSVSSLQQPVVWNQNEQQQILIVRPQQQQLNMGTTTLYQTPRLPNQALPAVIHHRPQYVAQQSLQNVQISQQQQQNIRQITLTGSQRLQLPLNSQIRNLHPEFIRAILRQQQINANQTVASQNIKK